MLRLKRAHIDTLSERVIFIHEKAVERGQLGCKPLDRVNVIAAEGRVDGSSQVTGILNFCRDGQIAPDEVGLSEVAFKDLGMPEGCGVRMTLAPSPSSVEFVRAKLHGQRMTYEAFASVLTDVVHHRYSKVELAMFVLACALQKVDQQEIVDFTRAMINVGQRLDFGPGPIADKHCIGGVPGNRTSMIVVPILAATGLTVPKTSSRAITSPAGTADTMGVLAEVALTPETLRSVVHEAGACIAWGGALDLAPADDILITVERPMELDTEPQMVASILAKKITAGATHALIDIPVGPSAKVRSEAAAEELRRLFVFVAGKLGLTIDVVTTQVNSPIGRGIGPRLEALDVMSVLQREASAPAELRDKSVFLAGRILEMTGRCARGSGARVASEVLESGDALSVFERIRRAQGERELPAEADHQAEVLADRSGRIQEIDCWRMARVAKYAGAPAHPAAGVRLLRGVGDDVRGGDPIYEIHSQSSMQLYAAEEYARSERRIFRVESADA